MKASKPFGFAGSNCEAFQPVYQTHPVAARQTTGGDRLPHSRLPEAIPLENHSPGAASARRDRVSAAAGPAHAVTVPRDTFHINGVVMTVVVLKERVARVIAGIESLAIER